MRKKGKLTCAGEEGRNAVELANAMVLSSASQTAVTFPLDRDEYSRLLEKMINVGPPDHSVLGSDGE